SPGERVRGAAPRRLPRRGDRPSGGHLPLRPGGAAGTDQRGHAEAAPGSGRLRGGALPGVRAQGRERVVPDLRRRRVHRRHRRGAAARARGAGQRDDVTAPETAPPPSVSRGTLLVLGLAVTLRVAVFPFAENKHGDSPMRALIAERMNLEPASAANPRTY